MNIQLHALKAMREGMPARFAVRAGVPGVQFLADDQEFIELADLGYNQEYGYYRLSALPSVRSECDNNARETIHRYNDGEDGEPMFVWQDGDGYLHQLGELWQVAELYQALGALLQSGELDPEPIDEYDPRWGQNYTIAQAVSEALTYGYATDADQTADSIRSAARAGRIKGARVVDGKWSIPKRTLRGWLVRAAEEKRGRPRQTVHVIAVASFVAPDTITKLLRGFGQQTGTLAWELFVTRTQLENLRIQCGDWVTFNVRELEA